MKNLFKTLLLTSVILFSSCATIISGSRQTVKLSSTPNSATVYINDVRVGNTPFEKSLKRNQNYDVLFKLEGYQPYEARITKKFNAWYIGNVLIGGVIGLIIDPITGAMFKLSPEELNANLSSGTVFKTDGNDIYLAVCLNIDPNWEKVGQLIKAK